MVTMYTSFTAENFRGFERFEIHNLKRINLLAGPNGSGKSTLLEAMFIHSGAGILRLLPIVNSWRGFNRYLLNPTTPTSEPWSYFLYQLKTENSVKLSGVYGDGISRSVLFQLVPDHSVQLGTQSEGESARVLTIDPRIATAVPLTKIQYTVTDGEGVKRYEMRFQNEQLAQSPEPEPRRISSAHIGTHSVNLDSQMIQVFSKLRLEGQKDLLIRSLRLVAPELIDLEILKPADEDQIYAIRSNDNTVPLPLSLLGGGAVRIALIVLSCALVRDSGTIFIDEIENGLHHSILPQFWQAIDEASRLFNVQVFATTHSIEIIQAANQVFREENASDFGYFRMRRDAQGPTSVVAYRDEALEGSFEMNLEVRG